MSLFDLQTVTFWQLKNAPRIADFETFKKVILPRPPRSLVTPTYLQWRDGLEVDDYRRKN